MHRFRKVLAGAAVLFPLAACELTPPRPEYPPFSYADRAPLRFDVAEIAIEQAYKPSSEAPNVELLFPLRPDQAAAGWARDRLAAAGSARRLRFVVRDAAVTETALETKTGLTGAMTIDQSERYDATLAVEVQIIEDGGFVTGTANAQVRRSITVAEDASLNDREGTWYRLTKTLMDDMNAQLEQVLKRVFFRFLR
jgi:hypothetical protein